MKTMPFKHDLEMWHKFAEYSGWIKFVSEAKEISLINLCVFYSWDSGAFEEYCNCKQIERKKDFVSKEECWKCPFYPLRTVLKKDEE